MTPSCIAGANGYPTFSRSENTAPSRVGAIWRTITGSFRCVSGTANDTVLPDNQRHSATPSTDLKVRDVKGTSLSPLDLPGTGDHAKAFKEVVRRIKTDQQSLIMEKVNAVTPFQLHQMAQCCRKPETITIEHQSFLKSDTFAYAALRAFREKKISRNEFATLVTLQGVYLEGVQDINSFRIVHHKLFDDNGEVNKYAWDFIACSLTRSEMFFNGCSFDVNAIIKKMERLLKNAPQVEAGFWICNYPASLDKNEGQLTMRKALLSNDFFVLFSAFGGVICPSMTLRQAFIDSFCLKEAHKINPVIGISTPEDIRAGSLKGHRDMEIPFPGHPLPKTADHLSVRLILEFIAHDFYHALRASMLRNTDIHLIVAVADVVRKIKMAFQNEYIKEKQDFQQKKACFESSISTYPQEQQDKKIEDWQKYETSVNNRLDYLRDTRIALGQFAFNLDDLETHRRKWRIHLHDYDRELFKHHLSNILVQLNRSAGKTWRKLLSENDAGIVGQCIIPMIIGRLSHPQDFYSDFCWEIDREANLYPNEDLSETQKKEYVARGKKLIEPLNPSVKLDQSQWPTFLKEAMKGDKKMTHSKLRA